ncbi:MAG TPA: FxsA family protein [Pirellulales bacterium]|nr:FxsA family protein [Pirellulales bacterium]
MLGRFLLLLMLLPAIEIALLVWIAMHTSLLLVLGLLVGAGALGAILARHQGFRTMTRISGEMRAGRMPADAMFDAVLVLVAAVLLILPGFLSDVTAILLLLPPTRAVVKAAIRRRVATRMVVTRHGDFYSAAQDKIIDVQVIDSPPRQIES